MRRAAIFRSELLGVFTVYCCEPISETGYRWLRALADHAAIAVAKATRPSEQLKSIPYLIASRPLPNLRLGVARGMGC